MDVAHLDDLEWLGKLLPQPEEFKADLGERVEKRIRISISEMICFLSGTGHIGCCDCTIKSH